MEEQQKQQEQLQNKLTLPLVFALKNKNFDQTKIRYAYFREGQRVICLSYFIINDIEITSTIEDSKWQKYELLSAKLPKSKTRKQEKELEEKEEVKPLRYFFADKIYYNACIFTKTFPNEVFQKKLIRQTALARLLKNPREFGPVKYEGGYRTMEQLLRRTLHQHGVIQNLHVLEKELKSDE